MIEKEEASRRWMRRSDEGEGGVMAKKKEVEEEDG